MKLSQIIKGFETQIPKSLQEDWDHSGLNLGASSQEVRSIVFAYDVCKEVVKFAKKHKSQLIVSHHPFRMSSRVNLDLDSYEGQIIAECIKNNIALYSSHTNHDASFDSLNFHYLKKLKLTNIKPLAPASVKLFKLAVFVPCTHTKKVMNALFKAGAGHIGNYSECSYQTQGIGTFKGGQDTNPAIGKRFVREQVNEDRLEVIFKEGSLKKIVLGLQQSHPYEEIAYDIYPIQNKIEVLGLGAIGTSQRPIFKTELIKTLKSLFKVKNIRFVSSKNKSFQKIAICTGSGASFLNRVIDQKADLFITGDLKYHQAIDAKRNDLAVVDIGHFYSERDSAQVLKGIFESLFDKKLKYHLFTGLKDAFEYL